MAILPMVVALGETGAPRLTDDFARLSGWAFLTIIDITGATANDYKNKRPSVMFGKLINVSM